MEDPKALRKGLISACVAAIVGAALFDGMIIADNWSYENLGHEYSAGWLLVMPSALLTSAMGRHILLNAYLVNGALGALLFALLAICWLAIRRGTRQSDKRADESN